MLINFFFILYQTFTIALAFFISLSLYVIIYLALFSSLFCTFLDLDSNYEAVAWSKGTNGNSSSFLNRALSSK